MDKLLKLTRNDGYYLPLFNLKGLKGSITPFFGGDLKTDQHHFALQPASELSLFENQHSRNVIFTVDGIKYFLNGETPHQQQDEVHYQFGMLYQTVTRKNEIFTLETTSYIPVSDMVEVHQTKITNHSQKVIKMDVVTSIPIYGRSADNIRDHRHVTSLLHQIAVHEKGVIVKPTLSFDERGHNKNQTFYSVFANLENVKVNRIITSIDDFIDGGSMAFPRGIYRTDSKPRNGYEAIGAIGFEPLALNPGETKILTFTIGIHQDQKQAIDESVKYFNPEVFTIELAKVVAFFSKYPHQLSFYLHDDETNHLLKWVTLQPVLRRHLGNSFLPHHDYGRGGRGWRDLWQDLLALIMFNDASVNDLLFNNFKGIRIDGSNATIIGDQPGEFKADRNNIVRIWSDHGAWPLLTTKMYIDETGDIEFLLKKQTYFNDQFTHYTYQTKKEVLSNQTTDSKGKVYEGSVFEHLLLQNIVAHLNVGENGFVKLEDADWNDGLDMAKKLGETVAFTHFYANNLKELATLLKSLTIDSIELFSSLIQLLRKELKLNEFFDKVASFDGKKATINKNELIDLLMNEYQNRVDFIRTRAWIKDTHYQSYINNDGLFSDSKETMSLTGQTMALLSKTATIKQAKLIASYTKKLLFDKEIGGYHLNSFYNKLLLNMGRAYGFAYGHKENGAIFSHMVMMYAYGLYEYGLIFEGHEAYRTLIDQAINKDSKVLAGIPEYFNDLGHGKYSYLTGSASWLLKLLRTHVFGLDFNVGKLDLKPKLKSSDFIDEKASIRTFIFGRLTQITYLNPKGLEPDQYRVASVKVNDKFVQLPLSKIDGNLEVLLDEVSDI